MSKSGSGYGFSESGAELLIKILYFFVYFFGGLECVGNSFTYVGHIGIRTQRAVVASRRANNLATHLPLIKILHCNNTVPVINDSPSLTAAEPLSAVNTKDCFGSRMSLHVEMHFDFSK